MSSVDTSDLSSTILYSDDEDILPDSFLNEHYFRDEFDNLTSKNLSRPSNTSEATVFKMDISKCKKFSGLSHENGLKFLHEFESYSQLYSLHGDGSSPDKRVPLFHLLLQGPARTWFNSLNLHDKSWLEVSELFQTEYTQLSACSPALLLENQNFISMSLSIHESLEDFYARLVERGHRIGKSDLEILSKFISALPEDLQRFVGASQPKDSRAALTAAQMGSLYGCRKEPTTVSHVQQPSNISELNSVVNQLSDLVEVLSRGRSSTRGNVNDSSSMRHRSRAPDRYTSPHSDTTKFVCFRCGGEGHKQFNCNWNGNGVPSPMTMCQLCSMYGHTAITCGQLNYLAPVRNNIQRPNSPGHPVFEVPPPFPIVPK